MLDHFPNTRSNEESFNMMYKLENKNLWTKLIAASNQITYTAIYDKSNNYYTSKMIPVIFWNKYHNSIKLKRKEVRASMFHSLNYLSQRFQPDLAKISNSITISSSSNLPCRIFMTTDLTKYNIWRRVLRSRRPETTIFRLLLLTLNMQTQWK